jgi:hypothetical protein
MRKKKKIPKTGIMLKQVPWPDRVALFVGLICQSAPPSPVILRSDIG